MPRRQFIIEIDEPVRGAAEGTRIAGKIIVAAPYFGGSHGPSNGRPENMEATIAAKRLAEEIEAAVRKTIDDFSVRV